MLTKTKLALVAALIAGSSSIAQANEALDPNTGSRTESYRPLHEFERQGVPIGDRARQYHGESSTPFAYRGGGFDARAQAPRRGRRSGPANCSSNHSNFGSSGAPSGPYCFEN